MSKARDTADINSGTNTAVGEDALENNTASHNTAVGYQAGYANTTGTQNIYLGQLSGHEGTTSSNNVFIGHASGYFNTASGNVGIGSVGVSEPALGKNTSGASNVAVGASALAYNTTASNNTAVGYQAGYSATSGGANTFVGRYAGYTSNGSTATHNTFMGDNAGYSMTSGSKNTILGRYTGNNGGLDIRTSSNNIVLSDGDGNPRTYYDGTRWNMTSDLGNWPSVGSGTLRITGQAGLTLNNRSNASSSRIQVEFYDLDNHLNGSISSIATSNTTAYNTSSDRRLKTNFADFDAMALIAQMNPVQYNRIGDIDVGVDRIEYGFIAQELHTVLPQAVQEGGDDPLSDPWQLDYAKITGVLTKAIQEQQATITALEARITALEAN